jgi:hypothetical protein
MFSFDYNFGPYSILERHGIGAIRYSPALGVPVNTRSADTASNPWKRKKAGASPSFLPLKLVTELRRRFLQCGDQLMGGRRNGACLAFDDLLRVG